MAIFNLHSKQKKDQEQAGRDIVRHDFFPKELRVQLCTILSELLAQGDSYVGYGCLWAAINKTLCREYGLQSLPYNRNQEDRIAVLDFLLNEPDVNRCLDVLQVAFAVLEERNLERGMPSFMDLVYDGRRMADAAVNECNQRFKEHRVGFQFVNQQIVRTDSEFTHQELTVPALRVLENEYLKGANEEFFAALDHHRHGREKACLNECLKAFESTMKAICHRQKWSYSQSDTAKNLIRICEQNGLFPICMESHLTGLRTVLESGVPTARNKMAGHGQGVSPIEVSKEFAGYVLNITAANIIFLAASEVALPLPH